MLALAADVAQNRMAQDEGALAALKATAAQDAILFAPGPMDALEWLDAQGPFPATSWRGQKVVVSCDGKMAAVTGAIQWDDVPGFYTTIWNYREGENGNRGSWRWVLSHGDGLQNARPDPQYPIVDAASCENLPVDQTRSDSAKLSADGSLRYSWFFDPEVGRRITVELWDGTRFRTGLEDTVEMRQADQDSSPSSAN